MYIKVKANFNDFVNNNNTHKGKKIFPITKRNIY